MSTARELLKKVLLPKGKDAWLFNRDTLRWFEDQSVELNAPPSYQLFRRFCSAQFPAWGPVIGGHSLLKLLRALPGAEDNAVGKVTVDGMTVHVDLRDSRFLQIPNELRGQTRVASQIPTLLAPGDTFIDVGANYGALSVIASRAVHPGGKTLSFEPNPNVAALLRRTLSDSAMVPHEVHQVGCDEKRGHAEMFVPETSGAGGFVQGYSNLQGARRFTCELVPLDGILASLQPQGRVVLKIDVEGFELNVLRGAKESLKRLQPTLLLEINPEALKANQASVEELQSILTRAGYFDFSNLKEPGCTSPIASLDFDHHRDILLRPH